MEGAQWIASSNVSNVEDLEKQVLEERSMRKEAEMQLKVITNVISNFKSSHLPQEFTKLRDEIYGMHDSFISQ